MPAFVLAYLGGLPRVAVLTEALNQAGRQVLVQWRHRHPCRLENVVETFPDDSLLLFPTGPDFTAMSASPAPVFFDGDALTAVEPPRPASAGW